MAAIHPSDKKLLRFMLFGRTRLSGCSGVKADMRKARAEYAQHEQAKKAALVAKYDKKSDSNGQKGQGPHS